MSAGDVSNSVSDLETFYDYLFEGRKGYVHTATKEPAQSDDNIATDTKSSAWKEYFFAWPEQRNDLVKFTVASRSRFNVYVAPSLFREREATKEHVLDCNFVWVEFDDVPPSVKDLPPPTCRVASGGNGHEHWYWKLNTYLSPALIETINQALTYHMDGDPSGWDCTQVLRPPETFNHKRKKGTSLLERSDIILDPSLFEGLPVPPKQETDEAPQYIPAVEEVIAKYPLPKTVRDLFFGSDPHDRSDALMALGYHCAEIGMAKPEILSVILNADERWKKFKGRSDRMRRLMEIVSIAVKKYPKQAKEVSTVSLQPMGFKTLLSTEVQLEWQWDGFLQKDGYFLLSGPTGVGKTQFSLNVAGNMALGKPFLDKDMEQARIGFFSLEMGLTDLKYFLSQMQFSYTLEEQEVLEQNLLFFPLGEPLYITRDAVRAEIEQIIGDLKLDGIMIDSLGAATDEALTEETAKAIFHWDAALRQRRKVFTWYIHHHRKASTDNRKPKKIDDVYGNVYVTTPATSIACLWDSGVPNYLEYITLKKRLAPKEAPFIITRDERLKFIRAKPGVSTTPSQQSSLSPSPVPGGLTVPAIGSGPQNAIPGPVVQPEGQGPPAGKTLKGSEWGSGPKTFGEMDDVFVNLDFKDIK